MLRRTAPCCAVVPFAHTIVPGKTRSTRSRYLFSIRVEVYGVFAFFVNCPLSVLFMFFFRKLRPYCRSDRDIASKHPAQHRAISSAQAALDFIKSLVAAKHGPILSASFAFS